MENYNKRWWVVPVAVIVGVAIGGSVLTLWDGFLPYRRVGTVGEWLAAFGTLAAAIAAVDGSLRAQAQARSNAMSEYQREARRQSERSADHDREREEAKRAERTRRLGSAQCVTVADVHIGQNSQGRIALGWVVRNDSPTPIRAVRLLVRFVEEVRPPGMTRFEIDTVGSVISPGEPSERAFSVGRSSEGINAYAVQFFDVHGDEWIVAFGPVFGNGAMVGLVKANSFLWRDSSGRDHKVHMRDADWWDPHSDRGIIIGVDSPQPGERA